MRCIEIMGLVKQGHRVASGTAKNSPYPKGSIEMQIPYFLSRGLDLSGYYKGTLNLSIAPHKFSVQYPDFHFKDVHWVDGFPPEDFLFVRCEISHKGVRHPAYVYYPDPETKLGHFQDESTLEVVSEYVDGLSYGDSIAIVLDLDKVSVT